MIPIPSALLCSPSSNLQLHLETVTTESQEKIDAQAATIVKLTKAEGQAGGEPVPKVGQRSGQGRAKLGQALI